MPVDLKTIKTFESYLSTKKIDANRLQAAEPGQFEDLKTAYEALGGVVFDQRKKFLINDWRLRFPILVETTTSTDRP